MIAYAQADYHLHMSRGGSGHADSNPIEVWNWRRCFDEQLMQKVLPKLHGDQPKLQAILSGLLRYCEKELDAFDDALVQFDSKTKLFTPKQNFDELQKLEVAVPKPEDVRFPLSYTKLCRMHETLKRDQFVSYIG